MIDRIDIRIGSISSSYADPDGGRDRAPGELAQTFHFFEGRLVRHRLYNRFRADDVGFEATRVAELVEGESDRADVIRLFGEPAAESAYPLISRKENKARQLMCHSSSGDRTSALVIVIDSDGLVASVRVAGSPAD